MGQILTITFSPCLDKSSSVEELIPAKKLKCESPVVRPGGGGINVARALYRLGSDVTALFPAGGYTGQMLIDLMKEEGIPGIVISKKNETRENVMISETKSGHQYRFGMPDTLISESEWKECLSVIESAKDIDFIIASGSLPAGVPIDIYAQISRIAKSKNAKFVLDTSGDALKAALAEGVFLIKPNLGELAAMTGKEKLSTEDVEAIAKKM
ncbi:MAG: 1-phosphofructokinase family hexose kinase, partial [Bacteroidota bacterium]|nr:1-phosphofructokinase family hexose kinase [Bacteroidota bacterium]